MKSFAKFFQCKPIIKKKDFFIKNSNLSFNSSFKKKLSINVKNYQQIKNKNCYFLFYRYYTTPTTNNNSNTINQQNEKVIENNEVIDNIDEPFDRIKTIVEKLNSIALEGQTPPITDPTMVQHPIPLTEHQWSIVNWFMKFSDYTGFHPILKIMEIFEYVHTTVGLPWWQTIVILTFIIRFLTLFLYIPSARRTAVLSLIQPEIREKLEAMKLEPDYLKKLKYREDIVKIQADYGIHKGIIAMFPFFMAQAFTFITFYWSILKLSKTNQSFSEEGFLWVQSLASYDPIYLLPFISFISLVGVFEINTYLSPATQQATFSKIIRNAVIIFTGIGTLFLLHFPAGVFIYWISSSIFSAFQSIIFKLPKMMKLLKIPRTKEEIFLYQGKLQSTNANSQKTIELYPKLQQKTAQEQTSNRISQQKKEV
jgi:YidC/Oxa1 family membrane protein insertase